MKIVPVDISKSITSSTTIRAQWTDYNTKITIKVYCNLCFFLAAVKMQNFIPPNIFDH